MLMHTTDSQGAPDRLMANPSSFGAPEALSLGYDRSGMGWMGLGAGDLSGSLSRSRAASIPGPKVKTSDFLGASSSEDEEYGRGPDAEL
jgi:hypothetical protein